MTGGVTLLKHTTFNIHLRVPYLLDDRAAEEG